jgi:hypothetical protein
MKADATAEKRPAYPIISGIQDTLTVTTNKYQGGVEVIVVLFVKVLVVFIRLFPESFVEARSRVWLFFREGGLDGGGQVIAKPVYNAKSKRGLWKNWGNTVGRTFVAHLHLRTGSPPEGRLPRRASVSLRLSPFSMGLQRVDQGCGENEAGHTIPS